MLIICYNVLIEVLFMSHFNINKSNQIAAKNSYLTMWIELLSRLNILFKRFHNADVI